MFDLDEVTVGPRIPRARMPKLADPETYHHTLFEGVEAWYTHLSTIAERKGWGSPVNILAELEIVPMYAGQNQRIVVQLAGGKGKRCIHISVYKRDEGNRVYEVTAYIA